MSVQFPGGADYLDLPALSTLVQTRSAMSAVMWWRSDVIINANLIGVSTNNGGVPTANTRWAFKVNGDSSLQLQVRAPDAGGRVDVNSAVGGAAVATWRHLGGVSDIAGDLGSFYRDGAAFGSGAAVVANASTDATPSASGCLAAEEDGGLNRQEGRMDDCATWSRVLTAAEVSTIYACRGAVIPYNGLQTRWQFKGGAPGVAIATAVADCGPAAQTLTARGVPTWQESRVRLRRQIA